MGHCLHSYYRQKDQKNHSQQVQMKTMNHRINHRPAMTLQAVVVAVAFFVLWKHYLLLVWIPMRQMDRLHHYQMDHHHHHPHLHQTDQNHHFRYLF